MKKLTYPQIDNMNLWDRIVSRKRSPTKEKLLSIRYKIEERYIFYSEHFDSLDKILPLAKEEWVNVKDELIKCYGKNKGLDEAKKQIFDSLVASGQTKCPYCMLSRSNTLEHYFNKDDYPEFSVYIPNLIPCCSECNSIKGNAVFDSSSYRKYIHFYHDLIPKEQFLFVRFSFSDESDSIPLVNIELKFSENNYYSNLIIRHFENLSLISKYQDTILERLAPVIEEIKMNKRAGISIQNIELALKNRFKALSIYYGNNYWETCVYDGILNSPDFLSRLYNE